MTVIAICVLSLVCCIYKHNVFTIQVVKNGKCYIFIPSSNPYLQLEVNHLVFAQKSLQYLTFPGQLLTLLKTH